MTTAQDSSLPSLNLDGILETLGLAASGEPAGVAYTVIRGNDGPRWLLPQRSEFANTILREWRPYGRLTHLYWRGLRLAARCGALQLLPGTERVRLPRDAGKCILRRAGFEGDAAPPVVLAGNPHSMRKLVVFLEIPARGRVAIKVPLRTLARVSIGNEAEVLKRLNGTLSAPRLLGYQIDTGAAMQEYLPGRLGSRRLKPDYLKLLIALARPEETVTLRGRAAMVGNRLQQQESLGELQATREVKAATRDPKDIVARALTLMEDDTQIPATLVHGDFVPWNIRDRADGGCSLIDWESAEWTGMPLHDLCHFFYMQNRVFSPRELFYPKLVAEGSWRGYCSALEIPPALLPRLAAAFLLDTLAQRLESGPAGEAEFCLLQLDGFLNEVEARKAG
jgi:hypothetical protein